jgi:hypothetical protein
MTLRCMDCGCDYDAAMALSLLIPKTQWLKINPQDDGLLCANCIIIRAAKLPGAVNITGIITFKEDHLGDDDTPYARATRSLGRQFPDFG